ncbi:MAG: cell division protein FtsQ/DivIB [Thermoleophilaceae bacterium]
MSALAARLGLPLLRPLASISIPPRMRRPLALALAGCLALSAVYLLWFRDSGLVRVKSVTVSGATASDAGSLRRSLTLAARGMTTLHLDRDRLQRVASLDPVVERLELDPDFPHSLRIRVIERRAAAIAVSGRGRVPVAVDGSVLRGMPVPGALPVIALPGPPAGDRLTDRSLLVAVRVTGTAPAELLSRLRGVHREQRRGLVVTMRRGPDLVFGTAHHLRAKWAAIARVLADPASRGASYVDVRLPQRPAAGGLSTDRPGSSTSQSAAGPAPAGQPPAPGVTQAAPTTPSATQPQAGSAPQQGTGQPAAAAPPANPQP